MFGKRSQVEELLLEVRESPSNSTPSPTPRATPSPSPSPKALPSNVTPLRAVPSTPKPRDSQKTDEYHDLKRRIFGFLVEIIDVSQLTKMDHDQARLEIRDVVNEVVAAKKAVISTAERDEILEDICNDVLGFGPLEPLLAHDDITDIMINGATRSSSRSTAVQQSDIRFRDNTQLLNICQRIVSRVGRRVDETAPICDARLPDGSRVNVIVPPLALDGPALTIRKFRRDKLTLDKLVQFGTMSPEGAELLGIIGRVRCNILISGGTGSGKTTLLNCLTALHRRRTSASSPSRTPPSCSCSSRTSCAWRPARPTSKARAR